MRTLWGWLDSASHAGMLLDDVRVDAYADALRRTVQPGDVVLDVGTGSGVMAMLAARAGARRVFAVDRTGIVELAREHVAANGLAGVVEVIRADIMDLDALPEPPRVVVGEVLGTFAPDEGQHRIYASVRRLVRPDAVMIPARYRLALGVAASEGLRNDLARLGDVHGLRMTGLQRRLTARPAFVDVDPAELLGPETLGDWVDVDAPPPATFTAAVHVARDGLLDAVTCGFVAELAPGVELRTAVASKRTCWPQVLFPFAEPLPVRAGDVVEVEIMPRRIIHHATWRWSARRGPDERVGDGFDSMVGDKADLLEQIRGRVRATGAVRPSPILRAWAAALGAPLGDELDLDAMAARAHAAFPARYPNLDEARQDLLALLAVADLES